MVKKKRALDKDLQDVVVEVDVVDEADVVAVEDVVVGDEAWILLKDKTTRSARMLKQRVWYENMQG